MDDQALTFEAVQQEIVRFVLENFPTDYTAATLPLDVSLLEEGIIDSMGVMELVEFLEATWSIAIDESEITAEKMGGVVKMARFVLEKRGVGTS